MTNQADHSGAGGEELDAALRERYGMRKRPAGIFAQRWFIPALLFALIGGSWLTWSAYHSSLPEIGKSVISVKVIDSRHIELRYSVTFKSRSKAHLCQVIARDYGTNIVGEVEDHFPVGTRSQTLITVIPTRVAAVNADISRCAVE